MLLVQMVLIETVVTGFVDEFPRLGLNACIRFLTTIIVSILFFISGITMTTQVGHHDTGRHCHDNTDKS